MTKNPFCADTVHARDTAAAFQPPFGLKSAIWKSPLLVSPPPVHSEVRKTSKTWHICPSFFPYKTVSNMPLLWSLGSPDLSHYKHEHLRCCQSNNSIAPVRLHGWRPAVAEHILCPLKRLQQAKSPLSAQTASVCSETACTRATSPHAF